MEEDERSTEDLVAAFRSRRAANEAAKASAARPVPAEGHDPPTAPQRPNPAPRTGLAPPPSSPTSPAAPVPLAAPVPPVASPVSVPAEEADEVQPWPASRPTAPIAVSAPPPRAVALRPAVQGASSLAAAAPALNLTDRLLADRFVASRGHRGGSTAGVATALLGALVLAASWFGIPGWQTPTLDSYGAIVGAALVLLGVGVAVLFAFVPRTRQVRVRFAPTQRAEWDRLQREARRFQTLLWVGVGLAAGGLLVAAALRSLGGGTVGSAWPLPLAVAMGGLVLLGWVAARRSLLQRLYVQTLVLSRLEHTGLGPSGEPDPRIGPVLRSLDRLLGALPESAVRRFLASDEATSYLELMDELEGKRRAP